MSNIFKQFDAKSVAATENAWNLDIPKCGNIFPGHVSVAIELLQKHSNYVIDKPITQMAYGVFEKSSHIASGIVDVIVTKVGKKYAKMLDCHIRPIIANQAITADTGAVMAVVDIYVSTVMGAMELGGVHNVREVKVYGRSKELLSVLIAVENAIKKRKLAIKAKIEGRWLVLHT